MKLTVIPADQTIIKNGRALSFAFAAPANLHALQWDAVRGVCEYLIGPAECFDDAALVAPYSDAFDAESARLAALEAAAQPSPAQTRAGVIRARLAAIDMDSIRALRAKSAGKGKSADDTKLDALDAEADTLRAELAALVV
jgi:hypothetical protein